LGRIGLDLVVTIHLTLLLNKSRASKKNKIEKKINPGDHEEKESNEEVGPGKYNAIIQSKKNFHVSGGTSVFLSKVQRLKSEKMKKEKVKQKENGKTVGIIVF